MNRKSSDRHSNESLNFQLHTHKKPKLIGHSSEIENTGYGMIPNTQRKPPIYQLSTTLQFDKKNTPLKYESTASKEINPKQTSSDTIKYRQTLHKLDQTEQKLVTADKKYGELWRKYEAACESIKSLNKQLSRAEEKPFDLQVKCNLLEKERDELKEKLRQKDGEKDKMRDNLSYKGDKMHKLQEKMEQGEHTIKKLRQEGVQKSQTIQSLQQQLVAHTQSQTRSYERIISTLKQQIQLLHSELTLKTQQLSTIQRNFYANSIAQKHESSGSSVSQLHVELNKLHKEKIALVTSYEQKLTGFGQDHKLEVQKLQLQVKELTDKLMGVQIDAQLKKEEHQNQWLTEIKKLRQSSEMLQKENEQLNHQVDNLHLTKDYLQTQVTILAQQNHKAQQKVALSASDQSEIKLLFQELQWIKKEFSLMKNELSGKEKELSSVLSDKSELMREISKLQLQVKTYQNLQLEYDKRVKQANDLMLGKMQSLQAQRQQMQRQLLAQRLQTINLKQQLSQQQLSLKREYQLSLSNVKAQLSQKIVSIRQEKNTQTIEKEKNYSQMKELQRKYQLLASEMLTVNDMMSIATKVHKRHSNFVKK